MSKSPGPERPQRPHAAEAEAPQVPPLEVLYHWGATTLLLAPILMALFA